MVQMGRPVRVLIISIMFIVNSTIPKIHEHEHFHRVVVQRRKFYPVVVPHRRQRLALVYLDQYRECMLQRPTNRQSIGNGHEAYHLFRICNKAMETAQRNPII